MTARKPRCASCGQVFAPKRSTGRYCKPACRDRARRERVKAAKTSEPPAKKAAASKRTEPNQTKTKAADNHELVVALRQELETAGALGTFEGQLALELARRLVTPGENASALADKVRAAKAAALGQAAGGGADSSSEPEDEDDEVTRARKQREESRQAAGLA